MRPTLRRPCRVLLDSNVWRVLADDQDLVGRVEQLCRRKDLRVLVAPAVVYEALRTTDTNLRARLIAVMTRQSWRTLMPESFEECEEFIAEVRRLRPEWLIQNPDLSTRTRHHVDWLPGQNSYWDRVRCDPAAVAGHVTSLEGDRMNVARSAAHEFRRAAHAARWKFDTVRLTDVRARPEARLAGWKGDEVEVWRLAGLAHSSAALSESPYSDWVSPIVDLASATQSDRSSWTRFWLYEAAAPNMPRWWIRSAFEVLQSLRKVTDGTPCDEQLATYVFSSDAFLTYDRAFASILERCRASAPVPMPPAILLDREATSLLDALDGLRRHLGSLPAG